MPGDELRDRRGASVAQPFEPRHHVLRRDPVVRAVDAAPVLGPFEDRDEDLEQEPLRAAHLDARPSELEAGSKSVSHASTPWRAWANSRPATSPGTATDPAPTWNTWVDASPKSITTSSIEPDVCEGTAKKQSSSVGSAPASRSRETRPGRAAQRPLRDEPRERGGDHGVDGVIFGREGGFTVDLGGAVAFLPGSQVDIRPVRDVGPLMDLPQPFQILKMDRRRGNIVVSRRAILEETRAEQRSGLIQSLAEGQVIDGVVKNITDYGAFVDLGGIDGLLHVTDISYKRVSHPSEVIEHRRHGQGADHPHQPRDPAHQPRHEAARERSVGRRRRQVSGRRRVPAAASPTSPNMAPSSSSSRASKAWSTSPR